MLSQYPSLSTVNSSSMIRHFISEILRIHLPTSRNYSFLATALRQALTTEAQSSRCRDLASGNSNQMMVRKRIRRYISDSEIQSLELELEIFLRLMTSWKMNSQ